MAMLGFVRPVYAVAVALTGPDVGQVAVPQELVTLGQPDPGLGSGVVEQAEVHLLRDLAEDGEIGAAAVVCSAERIGRTGPDAGLRINRHNGATLPRRAQEPARCPHRRSAHQPRSQALPARECRPAALPTVARHRGPAAPGPRSEEHTSELQSRQYLVCRLLLETK